MSLLIGALKQAISEIAARKGLKNFRVLDKVNARGELVIALIIPQTRPPKGSVPPRDWTR
ncbi:MAG: hypothetical protein ABIP89_18145 [Polyangiaceae bacterium]